ncbi:glycosyltransferase family 4 protein [Thiocapsa rosea]|uniref:Glycosyltransferase involved in cell wall biosynthesis n=1 Tax=Thiocapsa rosea TaxID=69360 RepID=A0A495VAC5_9GAMM|nr:glycosyltransferase family 4 protein [Thiocapsa rosea]RKT45583.1 glycosyltransferase involved in cell wall biosynthesis [Thiocapsa rosea]
MRILYLHQFFAGPDAPGPVQPRALVQYLAARGHQVDVIACDFNAYNEQDEQSEWYEDESGGFVKVHRLPAPRNLRTSLYHRLATYGRFAWSAHRYGSRMSPPDVVMATIQPLFSGYAALRLARRWRRPFLLEIRDLWPDALVAKKAIAPWQAAPLQVMARSIYFGADRLVSLTPGIKTELLGKGVPAERLDLFPNGCDSVAFGEALGERQAIRDRYGWADSFVAVYTGAHTEVTAIDVIVRAAMHLRDRPDIRIDLFGSGQTKPAAMALARALGLGNVHFHDPVPKSQVPGILAGADAGLMTLFHSPLIHIYFENKLIDYMGAGKPILGAMGGVQASLIAREGAGRLVAGLDDAGLARLIREAADDPAACRRMGEAGRAFVTANLAQEVILARYADVLESLVRPVGERPAVWDPLGLS